MNLNLIPDPWKNVARPYVPLLVQAFASQGIQNQRVLAYASATIGPESSWNPKAVNTTDPAANTGYPGAGLAQITWKENYEAVSRATGIDFVNHPDYMFDPLKSLTAMAAFLKIRNLIPIIEAGDYKKAGGIYNGGGSDSVYANKVATDTPTWLGVYADGSTCASSPSRENCDSKDPQQQGCSGDAYTVTGGSADIKDRNGVVIGKVELRYSNTCQSNWCRVQSLIGAASLSGTINREGGGSSSAKFDNVSSMYTDMVYAPEKKAQACGSVNGHSACTDWR